MLSFQEFLLEAKTDTISVFDIDDTLVFSANKIGVKKPGEKMVKVSTEEFAEIRQDLPDGTEFDFSEFIDFDSIIFGIKNGTPNIKVLRELNKSVKEGEKIGILTARGNQEAVYNAIKNTIVFKDKNGEFRSIPQHQFNRKFCFAVSDKKVLNAFKHEVKGDAADPSALKAYVLQDIFGDKMGFKKIKFFDDDSGNINKVKELNDPRITAIKV